MLTYRCPHCSSTVEVHEELSGETIVCPEGECGRPMKLEVHRAPLVAASDDGAGRVADHTLDHTEVSEEHEITRVHPAMFRNHPLAFLAGLVVLLGAVGGSIWLLLGERYIFAAVGGALVIAAAFWFFVWWLKVVYTTLTITSKRTVFRRGIVSKSTSEVRHDDVRNLQVDQGFLERILGVGTLSVSSAGQDDLEIVAEGFPHLDEIAGTIRSFQG